jgi:hypothetical protein
MYRWAGAAEEAAPAARSTRIQSKSMPRFFPHENDGSLHGPFGKAQNSNRPKTLFHRFQTKRYLRLKTNTMNQPSTQPNETGKTIQGLEDLWDGGEPGLARKISSYLDMEDLFRLEQTSKTIQKHLTAEDTSGIWRQVDNTTLKTSLPPAWVDVDDPKAIALAVLKADAFARKASSCCCCEETDNEEDLQEMGRDVAYEFFNIEELDGQEDIPKAGYELFVRFTITITNNSRREEEILFRGFPIKYEMIQAEGGPLISTHRLILSTLSESTARNSEHRKLVASLDPETTGMGNWQAFGQMVNIIIIAAHAERPYRLIRATRGVPTEPRFRTFSTGFGSRRMWTSVQTKSISSNAGLFSLNGIPHFLRCEFGVCQGSITVEQQQGDECMAWMVNSGDERIVVPFLSLSFEENFESLLLYVMQEQDHRELTEIIQGLIAFDSGFVRFPE